MTLLEALKTRAVEEGGFDDAAVVVTRGASLPDVDTPVVRLIAVGGPGGMRTHNGGRLRDSLVQVTVRALRNEDAVAAAELLHTDAFDVADVTVETVRFLTIRPVQDLLELPADSNGRALVAFRIQARHAVAS